MQAERECGVCGAVAGLVCADHPGYRQDTHFAIYACADCQTSFADPMAVDAHLYDDIYRNAPQIPGYARYASYAEMVAEVPDPLALLAREEAVYWGIAHVFDAHPEWRRVLEIGSGYGYLTYGLSRRGLDARGIDISAEAVARAQARFGKLYEVSEIATYRARSDFAPFDAVVFTELLEHVPDIHGFIEAALTLLKPGGSLVMTTPNRSLDPGHVIWNSDLPPVHLWWFSERSIETLARRHGLVMRLVDFSAYNSKHLSFVRVRPDLRLRGSLIDAEGRSLQALPTESWLKSGLRTLLRLPGLAELAGALSGRRRLSGPRTRVLCAVLQTAAPD